MSGPDRRIVLQHEDGMRQIVGIWQAGAAVLDSVCATDEHGQFRMLHLVSSNDRYIQYRTDPPGTPIAAA